MHKPNCISEYNAKKREKSWAKWKKRRRLGATKKEKEKMAKKIYKLSKQLYSWRKLEIGCCIMSQLGCRKEGRLTRPRLLSKL